MSRAAALAAWALLLAPVALAGQTPPPRPEPGEPRAFRLPETERFTLENGLTVTLAPYGRTPKVTVLLVLPTGSVDEAEDEVWLAALTGDLAMQGTTSRDAEQITVDAAAMGGTLSLTVGADRTNVGADVLEEHAPGLVRLIADVVRNPTFPASELGRLQDDRLRRLSVALQQPGTLTQAAFVRRLYPDHPYGRTLPTPDMIRSFDRDRIASFWGAHYGPVGAHLYVSGRFDAGAVRDAVEEALGPWSREDAAPPPPAPTPAGGRELVFVERPGAPQSTLFLGLPVVDPSHEDYVALQVTNALLGGSFASRIVRNIREDKGYTYSPSSFVSSRYRSAYWVQTADVGSDVTGAALREILFEIDRLREEPPSAEELRGIQNYLAGLFVLQNSSRGGIVAQLSFLDLHGLPREYLTGYVERVHAVTPEEVRRIARTYLTPDRMLLAVTGDPALALPQIRDYGPLETVAPTPTPSGTRTPGGQP